MGPCPVCKQPIPFPTARCPSCNAALQPGAPPAGTPGFGSPRSPTLQESAPPRKSRGTLVESVDNLPGIMGIPDESFGTPTSNPAPAAKNQEADQNAAKEVFRPRKRPPLAILCAFDDGIRTNGEIWRLRQSRFVIGRRSGDAVIGHDTEMSAQHCELELRSSKGRHRWRLRDLGSTNGTFVRVASSILAEGQQLLLGGTRYEFRSTGTAPQPAAESRPQMTAQWQAVGSGSGPGAKLIDLTPEANGREYMVAAPESYIGTDSSRCGIAIPNDPFLSPRHARFHCNDKGEWFIENRKSTNGVWLRAKEITLDANAEFQCGEQRFILKLT